MRRPRWAARRAGNRVGACALIALSSAGGGAADVAPPTPAPAVAPAGIADVACVRSLVVLANGRQKPLETYARETLASVFGTARLDGRTSLSAYVSILFEPAAWIDRPLIRPAPDVAGRAFDGKQAASAREVLAARQRLAALVEAAHGQARGARSREEEKLADAVNRVWHQAVFLQDARAELRFLPDPASSEGEWLSREEIERALAAGATALRPGLEAFDALERSFRAGDAAGFTAAADDLGRAQRALAGPPGTPSLVIAERLVELELLYYAADVKTVGLALFAASAFLYLLSALARRRAAGRLAVLALALGILWNVWIVGGHTAIAGRLPLKNLHEVFLVVLFFVPLIGAFLNAILGNAIYGGAAAFLTAIGFVGSRFLPPEGYSIAPLVAILHSPWREVHILTIMLSYAILLVAMGLNVAFLIVVYLKPGGRTIEDGRVVYAPLAEELHRNAYHLVAWGFLFLTAGIATGAAWANASWGRYWGWDPKEVWATVAWAIFALFLHCRIFFRTRKETLAAISIVGYAAILFTYFGVSYLLPGLHAYR